MKPAFAATVLVALVFSACKREPEPAPAASASAAKAPRAFSAQDL